MHRIDSPGATPDKNFTEGDPTVPTPATVVSADWLNDVQENICRALEANGIVLEKGNYGQLTQLFKQVGTIPVATTASLGLVQIGENLNIDESGLLSAPTPEIQYAATSDMRSPTLSNELSVNPAVAHIRGFYSLSSDSIDIANLGNAYIYHNSNSNILTLDANNTINIGSMYQGALVNAGAQIAVPSGVSLLLRGVLNETVAGGTIWTSPTNGMFTLIKTSGTEWSMAVSLAIMGAFGSGWTKLTNGLILQWGQATTPASGSLDITFPVAFNVTPHVHGTVQIASAATATVFNPASGISTTGFTALTTRISTSAAVAGTFRWFAIGA